MPNTVPTQIRIDAETKQKASKLFQELGLDMSSAVNLFLKQCILQEAIPFPIYKPRPRAELIAAMEEAKQISHDPSVPAYNSFEELQRALEQ